MHAQYDVIVIGAGHSGTEAAFAAANLGSNVLILATSLQCVAMMPCNPSVGGPGKGHLVREIHALGGQIGHFVDDAYLQMRELNESRGPAVRALRAQADKVLYHLNVKARMEAHPNISLMQGEAIRLLHKDSVVYGVELETGLQFEAKAVILATGTFLNGNIILGNSRTEGGPAGHSPSKALRQSLDELKIEIIRLQTATPPRVAGSTLNFEEMKPLPGHPGLVSFTGKKTRQEQRSCYLTHTTRESIEVIEKWLPQSPLKLGNITQHGPKHCPSIDRKVIRFPDMETHHIFVEPESDFHDEWYLLGLTTSMPPEAQEDILKTIPGLQDARILRYGYAIEYDAVKSTQLFKTLEFKQVGNLFAAGQINGTSGYEEAAAQGLIAGINAHQKAQGKDPFLLPSTSSYLAEMLNDLVTNDRTEPLRVTTSSSEFRLHLRTDNAEERLLKTGYELGLVPKEVFEEFENSFQLMQRERTALDTSMIRPDKKTLQTLEELGSKSIKNPISLFNLLAREEIRYANLARFGHETVLDSIWAYRLEILAKYDFFLNRLKKRMRHQDELDAMLLKTSMDYHKIQGLSEDIANRLNEVRPMNMGQAAKLKGIQHTEIALLIHAHQQGHLSLEKTS